MKSDMDSPPGKLLQHRHRQGITEPPIQFIPIIQQRPLVAHCLSSGRTIRPLLMREPHFDASRLATFLMFLAGGRHIYFCDEGGMMLPQETSDFGNTGDKVFREFLMAGLSDDDKKADASPHGGFLFVPACSGCSLSLERANHPLRPTSDNQEASGVLRSGKWSSSFST